MISKKITFHIPCIQYRFFTYVLSSLVVIFTIGFFIFKGLNYGIDFQGGILMEVKTTQPANLSDMRKKLSDENLGDVTLQEFGSSQDILIRMERPDGGEKDQMRVIERIKTLLGKGTEVRRIEAVGPKMGQELISNGLQAIAWALIAMLVYIWFRFEWQFGFCAILALIHDAIAVLGLYSIFRLEFNTTAIVAILITVGYSINDTVVIYDRVRENLKKYKEKTIDDILNLSVNETLSRTLLTSSSTLLALFALYFFGGEVIASYSLPIIIGVSIGTFSSIFLASPLLMSFNLDQLRQKPEEESPSPLQEEA